MSTNTLPEIARLHVMSYSGHKPHTAYLTAAGGVQVRLDDGDLVIKQATSDTVTKSGGPIPYLHEMWRDTEIEEPPYAADWAPAVEVESEDTFN
jgi:hypothetical protein